MTPSRGAKSHGTAELSVATFGAAAVGMLTSMVLTRAMTPEDFGAYRYVIAIVGMAAIVINVGFPYSAARLLTQQPPQKHTRTVAASLQLILLAIAVGAIGLAAFALAVQRLFSVSHLLLLASALVWTIALQRHFMYALRGAGRTRDIAVQTILPPTVILLLTTLLVLILENVRLGAVLLVTGTAYLTAHVWTVGRLGLLKERRLRAERSLLLKTQRGTGLPIYQGSLISVGVAELVIVLGGASVGERAFGEFSLALSLAAPAAMLPTVIGMVQFRNFGAEGRLSRKRSVSTALQSSLLAITGSCVGWLAFPLMFPDGFETARMMFPLLAAGFLFHGLGDYLNQYLQAQGAGVYLRRAAYGVGFVSILAGVATIPTFGVWGLAATKVGAGAFYSASMLLLAWRSHRA